MATTRDYRFSGCSPVGRFSGRKEPTPMHTYLEVLDELEHRIAVDGLHAHDPALAAIADVLVRTGTLPTIAGILADPTQPEAARMRALARAMAALRSSRVSPTVPALVA
jgi:hypothetical protein